MKVKVSEASGAVLDWLVAKCEGETYSAVTTSNGIGMEFPATDYSTDWAQGGPIIEREKISIRQWTNVPIVNAYMPIEGAGWSSDAQSPLIAAMRCYCCSKLGDEAEVPDGLTE